MSLRDCFLGLYPGVNDSPLFRAATHHTDVSVERLRGELQTFGHSRKYVDGVDNVIYGQRGRFQRTS